MISLGLICKNPNSLVHFFLYVEENCTSSSARRLGTWTSNPERIVMHITLAARPQERSRLNHPSSSILPLRQSSGGDVHASAPYAESPKSVYYRCKCDEFKTKVVGEEPVVVRSADFTMSRLLLALRDDAVLHHGMHQVILNWYRLATQIMLLGTSCSPCCPDVYVSVAIFRNLLHVSPASKCPHKAEVGALSGRF